MKLVYLTSKDFPGTTADHAYIEALGRAFAHKLDKQFLFVANSFSASFNTIPTYSLRIPQFLKKSIFFFLAFLPLLRKWGYGKESLVIFSNDQYLLATVVLMKKIFHLNYRIVSDWHMLFGRRLDGVIARESDLLITTSQKLEHALEPISSDVPIKTIYGGVDLEKMKLIDREKARVRLNLPSEKIIVAYIGLFTTLGMPKGLDTMIDALKLLPSNIVMLFVGGKQKEIVYYEELARSAGVFERCIFIPRVAPDAVYAYEKAADMLAIPYPDKPHFREYGFPMKVYEYMAAGKPIIYSKLDLVEEVVGGTGTGFSPDDSHSFAEAVISLMDNKEKAREQGRLHVQKAESLSWDAKAGAILKEMHSLV